MDRNTETTLVKVHEGIISAIKAEFPTLNVEAYRDNRDSLTVPACLVELTELEADDKDPGTEQLAMVAKFEAMLVLGFKPQPGPPPKRPKMEIRLLAAAFAAFVRQKRWGCPIGPAEVIGAYPSDFEPELDKFEVWRVEWQQVIHLGKSVWTGEGIVPTQVLGSFTPMIGIPHKDDYFPLASAPPVTTPEPEPEGEE